MFTRSAVSAGSFIAAITARASVGAELLPPHPRRATPGRSARRAAPRGVASSSPAEQLRPLAGGAAQHGVDQARAARRAASAPDPRCPTSRARPPGRRRRGRASRRANSSSKRPSRSAASSGGSSSVDGRGRRAARSDGRRCRVAGPRRRRAAAPELAHGPRGRDVWRRTGRRGRPTRRARRRGGGPRRRRGARGQSTVAPAHDHRRAHAAAAGGRAGRRRPPSGACPAGWTTLEPQHPLAAAEPQRAAVGGQLAGRQPPVLGRGRADAEPLAAVQLQVGADVRVERPHRPLQLDRRPGRVEAALGGGDLLGVGGQRVVLVGELELARRRAGPAPARSARRRARRGGPKAMP